MASLGSGTGVTPDDHSPHGETCIPNISQPERRKRLAAGVVQFALGLVVLGIMLAARVDTGWRVALLLPFWGAAVGFLQWRDKT